MSPEQAAQLLYEHWLVMPLTHQEKLAIQRICHRAELPDPGRPSTVRPPEDWKPKGRIGHPWGDPEVDACGHTTREGR